MIMSVSIILQLANVVLYLIMAGCAIVITKAFHDDCKFYQDIEQDNYNRWLEANNGQEEKEENQ